MTGSIPAIVTAGLGTFGSVNLMVTIGYGTGGSLVYGPLMVPAADIYLPGMKRSGIYSSYGKPADIYRPAAMAGK